jgi:hypothetical protein
VSLIEAVSYLIRGDRNVTDGVEPIFIQNNIELVILFGAELGAPFLCFEDRMLALVSALIVPITMTSLITAFKVHASIGFSSPSH